MYFSSMPSINTFSEAASACVALPPISSNALACPNPTVANATVAPAPTTALPKPVKKATGLPESPYPTLSSVAEIKKNAAERKVAASAKEPTESTYTLADSTASTASKVTDEAVESETKETPTADHSSQKSVQSPPSERKEAVAVEDSTPGVQSAKNANIYCYGYANPKAVVQDVSLADKIIENLKEIIE